MQIIDQLKTRNPRGLNDRSGWHKSRTKPSRTLFNTYVFPRIETMPLGSPTNIQCIGVSWERNNMELLELHGQIIKIDVTIHFQDLKHGKQT